MEPSSFMISQMTPPGRSPARRARSTTASVCPARTSTPPSRARKGKTWPGRARSVGLLSGFMATRMVWARSAAEIPVVTPSAASMDSVNAVPRRAVFRAVMGGSAKASQISGLSGRQMSPRACLAMKLMTSGVTFSAAMVTSPSFSRSSSSTMTSMRPARKSSMASGMGEKGILFQDSNPRHWPRMHTDGDDPARSTCAKD